MSDTLHLWLTYATIAVAVGWLVRHFTRRTTQCDRCEAPQRPTRPHSHPTAVRRRGLAVLQNNGNRPS